MQPQLKTATVFFVVPLLGRMSDSERSVREQAALAFAQAVRLVPLEQGCQVRSS